MQKVNYKNSNDALAKEEKTSLRDLEAKDLLIKGKEREIHDMKQQFELLNQQLQEHQNQLKVKEDDFLSNQFAMAADNDNTRKMTMQFEASEKKNEKQIKELKS